MPSRGQTGGLPGRWQMPSTINLTSKVRPNQFRGAGFIVITENQMEKKMGNDMETWIIMGYIGAVLGSY